MSEPRAYSKVVRLPDRRGPKVEFAPPVDSLIDFIAKRLVEEHLAEHPIRSDAASDGAPE